METDRETEKGGTEVCGRRRGEKETVTVGGKLLREGQKQTRERGKRKNRIKYGVLPATMTEGNAPYG